MIGVSNAFAGKITFPDSCWSVADHYLIRVGAHQEKTSEDPGARLWNLDQLSSDWSYSSTSDKDCVAQVYKQALADGNEYWSKINQKYCSAGSKNEICSKPHGVAENLGFLKMAQEVAEKPEGFACADGADNLPGGKAVRTLGRGVIPAVQRLAGARTTGSKVKGTGKAKAPEEKAEGDTPVAGVADSGDSAQAQTCNASTQKQELGDALIDIGLGCGKGFLKQLLQEYKDVVTSLKYIFQHPLDALSTITDFVRELIHDPYVIYQQIYESYAAMFPKDTTCMSKFDISTAVCKIGTRMILDLGLTFAGGAKFLKTPLDFIKWSVTNAVSKKIVGVGVKAAEIGAKVGGKVVPKVIKDPVKAAAAGAASRSLAAGKLLIDKAALKAAEVLYNTKTGAAILKVSDGITLVAEKKGFKGKMAYWSLHAVSHTVGLTYLRDREQIEQYNKKYPELDKEHQEKLKVAQVSLDKFVPEVVDRMQNANDCQSVSKTKDEIFAKYHLNEGSEAAERLAKVTAFKFKLLGCKAEEPQDDAPAAAAANAASAPASGASQ